MKGGVKVKQLDRSASVGQGLTKNTSFLECDEPILVDIRYNDLVVSAYFSQTVMKYKRKMKPSTPVRGSQGLIISASPIAQLVRAPH